MESLFGFRYVTLRTCTLSCDHRLVPIYSHTAERQYAEGRLFLAMEEPEQTTPVGLASPLHVMVNGEGDDGCERTDHGLAGPGGTVQIVEELVCRKLREGIVHHPGHQLCQLSRDFRLHLFQDLLAVIVEKLVDSVCKEFVFSVEKIVHVDKNSANVEINV